MKEINNSFLYDTKDITGPLIRRICRAKDGLFRNKKRIHGAFWIEYVEGDEDSISFVYENGIREKQPDRDLYNKWTIQKLEEMVDDGTYIYF